MNTHYPKTCRIHCAISHSAFHHTHTRAITHPSKVHGTSLNNCQSFYSQFEFWNLAKIILFGSSFWQPRCARVHRPHRTHPSAPPLMFVSAVRDRRPPSSSGGLTAGRGQARWPDRPSGGVAERLIHKLAGLTALRPSQHCITNLIDVEMTGRTSTKVTQFLIQRWKIVNDSVF